MSNNFESIRSSAANDDFFKKVIKFWDEINDRMAAMYRANLAFWTAVRKGEEARDDVVKEDDPYLDFIALWFEYGILWKPIFDAAAPPAQAAIAVWIIKQIRAQLDIWKIR